MEILRTENSLGTVRIADEVVEIIAGMAASEIEGVAESSGGFVGDIANIFSKGKASAKGKGIKVEVAEKEATVNLYLAVEYGFSLITVAEKVQAAVKEAIEVMTGLVVEEVNVFVQAIVFKQAGEGKEN